MISYPPKIIQLTDKDLNYDTSSFDITTYDNEIAITINMPDAKEEEINFRVIKDTIELMFNTPKAEYHRFIKLPCNVKSKTATFTYKNGVLDIIITREKGGVKKIEK